MSRYTRLTAFCRYFNGDSFHVAVHTFDGVLQVMKTIYRVPAVQAVQAVQAFDNALRGRDFGVSLVWQIYGARLHLGKRCPFYGERGEL